ncbi:MAG: sucrase ferredoxin [Crocosphaera sp.]|nr:sucrase ferredoxin [Crocosphaera sp.]
MQVKNLVDCQLCSVIAKNNGEDPIGTAKHCDGWLIIEWPQPWIIEDLMDDSLIEKVFTLIQQCKQEKGVNIRPILIAPDVNYSVKNNLRIIYYQSPGISKNNLKIPFFAYIKNEFVLPQEAMITLITDLLIDPDKLSQFDTYKQSTDHIRDILVCTHGNVDLACSRFGFPIYNHIKKQYSINNDNLRVWRCSHFGGHQFAPTLIDFPIGQVWGHLETEILDNLIYRQGNVEKLRNFYRGWTGLSKFGQIVERELWIKWGWPWLNYKKSEQILTQFPDNNLEDVEGIEVRLEAIQPDNKVNYIYQAKVEVSGEIETVKNSGENAILIKQYAVSQWKEIVQKVE